MYMSVANKVNNMWWPAQSIDAATQTHDAVEMAPNTPIALAEVTHCGHENATRSN